MIRNLEGLTVVPAILMTILFCRAIIIWLINVIIFGVVIQAVIVMRKKVPTAEFVEVGIHYIFTVSYNRTCINNIHKFCFYGTFYSQENVPKQKSHKYI